jgi:hypothetical protein
MPYQVRKGSLTIMAHDAASALMVFDGMDRSSEPATIWSPDGQKLDPEAIRAESEQSETRKAED